MFEGRLEEIRERLESHDAGAYHDASDMAVGFGEVVGDGLQLVEEVELLRGIESRAKELLRMKRIYLTNTRARQDSRSDVDLLALGRMEQRYVAEIHELEDILGIV